MTDVVDGSITQYCEEHDMKPEECVAEMRRIVAEETKLTASAGIAPNKVRFITYVFTSVPNIPLQMLAKVSTALHI